MKKISLLFVLALFCFLETNVKAQNFVELIKVNAADTTDDGYFGFTTSISGDKAIVGAYGGGNEAAYIFELISGVWTQTAKLLPGDGQTGRFGYSVSISGDKAIVGSYQNNASSGSAYVYELDGGAWGETHKLEASDGAASDYFGYSVSIAGDKVIVGAYGDDDGASTAGSAYIYEYSSGTNTWDETKILAPDPAWNDNFGYAVSISGDKAIVGSRNDDDNGLASSGSVYTFNSIASVWTYSQKLLGSDPTAYANFGEAVFIDGDRAIIGAADGTDIVNDAGVAFIFDYSTGTGQWSETQKLSASDATENDGYGEGVSISGDVALVGARANNAAYTYVLNTGTGIWSETQILTASDAGTTDNFGKTVSISGDNIIIGAYFDNDGVGIDNSGSAYFYKNCITVYGTDIQTACDSLVWINGSTYYTDNNSATHTLVNMEGCDSIVTLDLTILQSTTGSDVITACDSLVWIDGITYYSDNTTATHNLLGVAANTCDSLVTLNLTIIHPVTGTDVQVACHSYEWIDGITYTESNDTATHNLVGQAANGCDSIVTLDLTIKTVDTDVIALDPILTSTASAATYTWLDCDDNYAIIPDETAQNFIGTITGNYAVEVGQNGCIDTSDCYSISVVGLEENDALFNNVSIFPNPNNGNVVNINLGELKDVAMKVVNVNGQLMYQKQNINNEVHQFELNEDPGVYFIEIHSKGSVQQYKLIKL